MLHPLKRMLRSRHYYFKILSLCPRVVLYMIVASLSWPCKFYFILSRLQT